MSMAKKDVLDGLRERSKGVGAHKKATLRWLALVAGSLVAIIIEVVHIRDNQQSPIDQAKHEGE